MLLNNHEGGELRQGQLAEGMIFPIGSQMSGVDPGYPVPYHPRGDEDIAGKLLRFMDGLLCRHYLLTMVVLKKLLAEYLEQRNNGA